MIFKLPPNELIFPDPHMGEKDGLLAIGGDLSVERLLLAYSHGIFPWYSFQDSNIPLWYCPLQRFVIFPREIHISHSMRTLINQNVYHITINSDFDHVIENCSYNKGRNQAQGAWLGDDMKVAYKKLHQMGYATSIEVWNQQGSLVGGLYGVVLSKCFMGESMFSQEPNTSKLALIALAKYMQRTGGKMIDCQIPSAHLASMGGRTISYNKYMDILNRTE